MNVSKHLMFKVTFAVLLSFTLMPALSFAKDKDNNPPGPVGGKGSNWENPAGPIGGPGASPNKHRDNDNNPPGPVGGKGTNWEKNDRPRGWDEGKKQGWDDQGLPPGQYKEHKKNKPNIDFNGDGVVDETEKKTAYDKYIAPNKEKREHRQEMKEEWKEKKAEWKEAHPKPLHQDRDNNPPGPKGGKGTNWENPAGPKGGPGASPNAKPKKN